MPSAFPKAVFTTRLSAQGTHDLLGRASEYGVPIMVFVGNPGLIQIHTGPVRRIERMGPWLNVLDPDFNLHIREDRIGETWLVRKPGEPELVAWRDLAEGLAESGATTPGTPLAGVA